MIISSWKTGWEGMKRLGRIVSTRLPTGVCKQAEDFVWGQGLAVDVAAEFRRCFSGCK